MAFVVIGRVFDMSCLSTWQSFSNGGLRGVCTYGVPTVKLR